MEYYEVGTLAGWATSRLSTVSNNRLELTLTIFDFDETGNLQVFEATHLMLFVNQRYQHFIFRYTDNCNVNVIGYLIVADDDVIGADNERISRHVVKYTGSDVTANYVIN